MKYIFTFVLVNFFSLAVLAEAPVFRGKLSMYDLSVSAGEILSNEKLGSLVTLQPSVLWNFPGMNSRIGIHFLLDLQSKYGMTPISGIGLGGYYYFNGLTAAYEFTEESVLTQKTKPGFFTFANLTPVNINLNKIDTNDATNDFAFSATVIDMMIGFGFEYPLKPNSIISVEFARREGSGAFDSQSVKYSGFGLSVVYTTSYY